tara:strand:- start:1358 stop:1783 length:426 start_codon:yes stop_codon:yes gene_type:complete
VINSQTGAIVQAQSFDAFGNIENQSGDLLVPFGFAGGLTDQDTGLIRFGARDYDPQSARWTSKDPIKFNGDTLNIYRYVNNDPVNRLDSNGKSPEWLDDGVCSITGYCDPTDADSNDWWDTLIDIWNDTATDEGDVNACAS